MNVGDTVRLTLAERKSWCLSYRTHHQRMDEWWCGLMRRVITDSGVVLSLTPSVAEVRFGVDIQRLARQGIELFRTGTE